ncbi:fungal-specific transcription factor domain-containing protein [Aspergillus coremiiformis]|uniref:Fungal-specific transcription factor domain-containing protein n=1 Tax=Aspergillus coremiiformis TaxID=138285 RepID=A0A5N6YZ44_9EURO|nr:fungal-specific transcription factor domain-containing protein [Aspergillus coremiiformis]
MEPASNKRTRKSTSAGDQAPRKRRKRTVVSGAAEDCFTCAGQGIPCDRRRPYCSQCLDHGRKCSGYKTKLTWGMGVASRGKLRGLSLPVTGSQLAATPSTTPGPEGPQRQSEHGSPSISPSPYKSIPFIPLSTSATSATASPVPQEPHRSPSGPETHRYTTWINSQPNMKSWPTGFPPSAHHHLDHSDLHETGLSKDALNPVIPVPSRRTPNLSTGYHNVTVAAELLPNKKKAPILLPQWPCSGAATKSQSTEVIEERQEHENTDRSTLHLATSHSPSLSQLFLARSVGRTPRLRYLISYYAEVIAPMIVAFDGPTNPFRTYVLRLAQESLSLQEAIATLSTSNIRRRHERRMRSTERTLPARLSSLAHRALTDEAFRNEYGVSRPDGFTREEQQHRGMAVKALNMELADPHQRLSDSVLATLLVLCLFHICDTGVAQFKTQFAGVTKLLAIRMRSSHRISEELKWFIRIFTWFDTMTATTNDRETQLRGACLDIAAVSDGEWGLENLAGCDPSLFKFIAQLGRLNLLSQDRKVKAPALPDVFVPSSTPPPSLTYCYPPGSLMSDTPEARDSYSLPPPCPPQSNGHSKRPLSPTFWAEWYSLRQKLESWRLPHRPNPPFAGPASTATNAYISPPSSPSPHVVIAPQNLEDVFHISESFRHSAILYTERLADPDLPSTHPRIQILVHRAMQHISSVKSDVYLLWPLFITGSECVLERHRTFIRERCKDISQDSGFLNNLSCLELLEKIWAEIITAPEVGARASRGTSPGPDEDVVPVTSKFAIQAPGARPHGFRWHRVMQAKRAEGEYMVV